jgi:hypothetical protein
MYYYGCFFTKNPSQALSGKRKQQPGRENQQEKDHCTLKLQHA